MKITLPAKVTGTRDALFVLEVEFPVATGERTVEVEVQGPVEPLDLAGSSRGGTYRIPVGLERLHVPMRVTADGEAQATVSVRCSSGPDKGESESGTVVLEAPSVAAAGSGGRRGRWLAVAAAIAAVAAGAWGVTQLTGKDKVPDVRRLTHEAAEQKLREAGLEPSVRYEPPEVPADAGLVMRTLPGPGQEVPANKTVEVIVGLREDGLAPLAPHVGDLAEDAEAALKASGFQVVTTFQSTEDPGRPVG